MGSVRRLQGREVFRCSEVFRSRVNTSFNANQLKSFYYLVSISNCKIGERWNIILSCIEMLYCLKCMQGVL
jgi:hypothetical protein